MKIFVLVKKRFNKISIFKYSNYEIKIYTFGSNAVKYSFPYLKDTFTVKKLNRNYNPKSETYNLEYEMI